MNTDMNTWLKKHTEDKKEREEAEAANEEFIERQVEFYKLAEDIGLKKAKEIIQFMDEEKSKKDRAEIPF